MQPDSAHRLLGKCVEERWIQCRYLKRASHEGVDGEKVERRRAGFTVGSQNVFEQTLGCVQNFGRSRRGIVVESGPHRRLELLRRGRISRARGTVMARAHGVAPIAGCHEDAARCFRMISGAAVNADAMRAASGIPA